MVRKEILTKKTILKHRSHNYQDKMAPSYKSLQILPEKGSLGTHYFISKNDCYFEPLGYVKGGWAVLDLFSILFIKSELRLFHKISDNRILRSSSKSILDWSPFSHLLFKGSNYRATLVPLPEKVAPLKALLYNRIFPR